MRSAHLFPSTACPPARGSLASVRRNADALAEVVRSSRPLVEHLAKAKTAKLSASATLPLWRPSFSLTCRLAVRNLLDFFGEIPGSTQVQIDATKESAEWAKGEKRIFLKQNLETRLVALCVESSKHY